MYAASSNPYARIAESDAESSDMTNGSALSDEQDETATSAIAVDASYVDARWLCNPCHAAS
jgi:hypothetical protein